MAPGSLSAPARLPTTVWLTLSAEGTQRLECEMLGELLNRRSGTDGYVTTQQIKDLTSLKIANRLSEPPRLLTIDAASAIEFFRGVQQALPHSTVRWFWFANPGVAPPPGAIVRRIESIDGPDYGCFGGFDRCKIHDLDLRTEQLIEVNEGEIEICSETAAERYSSFLARAIEKLAPLAPADKVEIALIPPPRRLRTNSKGTWPTFDRGRMANRAQSIGRVAVNRLKQEMGALGFARASGDEVCGTTAWIRKIGGRSQYVIVDKWTFSSEIRVFLFIGQPFGAHSENELSAELCPSSEGESPFVYASQETLKAAIDLAAEMILTAGMEWLADPLARSRSEWKALGIVPDRFPKEDGSRPKVLPLP